MRHYITIIESRLEGRVSTDIQIDPDVLDVILPKMTLQPIIENAVKYGLEPLREPGILRVFTEVHAQELHIIIKDNGVGIQESTLEEMQELLRADTTEVGGVVASMKMEQHITPSSVQTASPSVKTRRGIGLTNVHRRIALMFGDAYGLRIHSKQGEGTTVIIAMPLPRKGM